MLSCGQTLRWAIVIKANWQTKGVEFGLLYLLISFATPNFEACLQAMLRFIGMRELKRKVWRGTRQGQVLLVQYFHEEIF